MSISITTAKRKTSDLLLNIAPTPKRPSPGAVSPKLGDVTYMAAGGGQSPARAVVSLGPVDELTSDKVRQAGGLAVSWLAVQPVKRVSVDLAGLAETHIAAAEAAFAEGIALSSFRFDVRKSVKPNNQPPAIEFVIPKGKAALTKAVQRALHICDGVNLARELAHEPPNIINPVTLADRATKLAKSWKLKCTVFDEKALKRMNAGAILAVGQGSATPSRMIVVEYHPGAGPGGGAKRATAASKAKPVILVGKAITFDTGGYTIKDKNGMVGMKYDKCGGMQVLGAMQAVAKLKPKVPVIGIIAAAENMISGEAYRPNDIITTMSGKTVEIISADAEGRLVLADALTYACREYTPRSIIDLATLTGGATVALGGVRTAMMSTDDKLASTLSEIGDRVHERVWRLPLDDDYLDALKGDDSDLKNSAGREGHCILGGMFLKQFVDAKIPWAHLDIAATGDVSGDTPYCPKGATGVGVRLLMEYVEGLR